MGDFGEMFVGMLLWVFVAGIVAGGLSLSAAVYAYHHVHVRMEVKP